MSRRNTASQSAVLQLLRESDCALNQDMVAERLDSVVNRSTIYRILNRFVEDGLVHRIVGEDGRQYFAKCSDCTAEAHHHDHPHFHCVSCERVECLSEPLRIGVPAGYLPQQLNVTVSGYCRDCNQNS
ncbi:Fur family ferric uptake transcriptional regulator [Lewinella aquimaris]|uniref:Fur family ferric uptake transcriptional regulator n=1 Tax=Neolewinella aquimaris TaxID=1835722 RepID=A0A840DZG8_9BACT|nr:transcriptional repressor [Neolewinella aquimaris]MBB4078391.1 Fur family ferric uptake transcriptional regulator [Neolewinella aquimaris]